MKITGFNNILMNLFLYENYVIKLKWNITWKKIITLLREQQKKMGQLR